MAAGEIHVGDIGTEIRVNVKDGTAIVNLSTATVKRFIFVSPGGVELQKEASFYTDGSDGILKYVTDGTEFDEKGVWKGQIFVELAAGSWNSDIFAFRVYPNL